MQNCATRTKGLQNQSGVGAISRVSTCILCFSSDFSRQWRFSVELAFRHRATFAPEDAPKDHNPGLHHSRKHKKAPKEHVWDWKERKQIMKMKAFTGA